MAARTELMQKILTSPEAQKIIDYVSPVYGDAYVCLNLFQCIGKALDEVDIFPELFRDYIFIQTAPEEALEKWEKQYQIYPEEGWDVETRRKNLSEKIGKHFNNPKKIENVLETMLGYEVELKENTAKNQFQVLVRGYVKDLSSAEEFVNKVKPAHLNFDIKVSELIEAIVNIYTGIYISEHQYYRVEVMK